MADKTRQAQALCKFGPGGDFTTVWQPQTPESSPAVVPCASTDAGPSFLARLVAALAESAITLVVPERGCLGAPVQDGGTCAERTIYLTEKVRNAFRSSKHGTTVDSASTATAADGGLFPAEPLLWPDDSRASPRVRHKPKHRVRTYRRAAKKRPAPGVPGQGSLFETHFKSARTA